jgi:hypothetical protein
MDRLAEAGECVLVPASVIPTERRLLVRAAGDKIQDFLGKERRMNGGHVNPQSIPRILVQAGIADERTGRYTSCEAAVLRNPLVIPAPPRLHARSETPRD